MPQSKIKLLLNREDTGHQHRLISLIHKAKEIECVVAFAKMSGWAAIAAPMIEAAKRGARIRFSVGLSFYQTEPDFLRALLKIARKYQNFQLYIGDTRETFHPKIYAFATPGKHTVIIGSANLTLGGFVENYEASAELDDAPEIMKEVVDYIDNLIEEGIIEFAAQKTLNEYERCYEINKIHQAVAIKKIKKAVRQKEFDAETLQTVLNALRDDKSDDGFDAKVAVRRERSRQANLAMKRLINERPENRGEFITCYEDLISQFNSGGLQRGKTRIANNFEHFLDALGEALRLKHLPPAAAYNGLAKFFTDIDRAGVNVLTEILVALDCERFANMNKNAVAGMARANIMQFPDRPLKTNVDGQIYAEYCTEANRLKERLGLRDFLELDTLFNHLYWN